MNQPNVILLTLDTLRADRLGCYGYARPITPNIDRLAANGVRFEQAITGGSWTQAAFPVLLTSTYASMYGGCLGPLSPDRPSPVEALAMSGYTTGGFSTSPLLSRTYGYQRGFEKFADLIPQEKDPALRHVKGGERLLRLDATHQIARLLGKRMRPANLYVPAETLVDVLGEWVNETERPFFAWAHYMDVHWPYHRLETLSSPEEIAAAWRDMGQLHRANWNGESVNSGQRAHYQQLYDRAIEYTDQQVGRLFDLLERLNKWEDSLVVLVSDHGEEFLERGKWGHFETNLYDEILKVPLIIKLPGTSRGMVVQQQARTLDIMPTILEICGCAAPSGMEGISMAPLWEPERGEYDAPLSISEMWRDNRHIVAARTEAYKYIWDNRDSDKPSLFDLLSDPHESTNLIGRYPEQAQFFKAQIDAHLSRVQDMTASKETAEPEMETDMIRRLRDLGYVE